MQWFITEGLTMKSMLIAAFVAVGCVLAVSPAIALSVTFNPGATTTSVPGAVLFDDFDTIQNTAIGTITGVHSEHGDGTRHREFHRHGRWPGCHHGDVYKSGQLRWLYLGNAGPC